MDYEKAYKEAITKSKEFYELCKKCGAKDTKEFLENTFPELLESEDEKCRKWLIAQLELKSDVNNPHDLELMISKSIAWLEKQGDPVDKEKVLLGARKDIAMSIINYLDSMNYIDDKTRGMHLSEMERKDIEDAIINSKWNKLYNYIKKKLEEPTDKIGPKFKVGDWVVKGNVIAQILDVQEQYYVGLDTEGNDFTSSRFLSNDKIHLWTIQDAKDGDVLDANGAPFIYKKHDKDYVYFYCGVNLGGYFIEANEFDTWNNNNKVYPATKEQRDLLFAKMKEAGYIFDFENKKLKKIKQKPATYEMSLEYAAKRFLETLSHSPYNNKPVVDAQVVVEELLKFLANPNDYNPDAINMVESNQVCQEVDEDYGIDGLWHAQRILEKTLGKVDGYQSDDGILEHKCAITSVNKLYKRKPAWSKEDEENLQNCLSAIYTTDYYIMEDKQKMEVWLESLKTKLGGK